MHILRDSYGDTWEVLPESGHFPRQDENWIRHQTEEMRQQAAQRTAEREAAGQDMATASNEAWADLYAEIGAPRVYVREVPHPESTGDSYRSGPRGTYEVIAWLGLGIEGRFEPGGMTRALVRPSARWYAEQQASAEQGLAETPDDDENAEARENFERAIEFNRRALRIASMHTRDLSVAEMDQALAQEAVSWQ